VTPHSLDYIHCSHLTLTHTCSPSQLACCVLGWLALGLWTPATWISAITRPGPWTQASPTVAVPLQPHWPSLPATGQPCAHLTQTPVHTGSGPGQPVDSHSSRRLPDPFPVGFGQCNFWIDTVDYLTPHDICQAFWFIVGQLGLLVDWTYYCHLCQPPTRIHSWLDLYPADHGPHINPLLICAICWFLYSSFDYSDLDCIHGWPIAQASTFNPC